MRCAPRMEAVVVATVDATDSSLMVSAMSSKHVTHTMDPAAKPRPTDRQKMKCRANMKTGTAMSGCGMLVKMDQSTVENLFMPRGSSTSATASPSGTLCIARDAVMKAPRLAPSRPVKATPMPRPSEKEWSVMTAIMRKTLLRSLPLSSPSLRSSCRSTHRLVATTNAMPARKPPRTRMWWLTGRPKSVEPSASSETPSSMSEKLAESIMPAAIALDRPSQTSETFPMKSNGSAPSPVDRAATQP
mmetsp:Transcript_27288/g.71955  ORF Transcript_27288/g.71955 Transcript_27288/m.71955 type:complete len:245 (+) Transcript_27288:111-845(+)